MEPRFGMRAQLAYCCIPQQRCVRKSENKRRFPSDDNQNAEEPFYIHLLPCFKPDLTYL